MSIRDIIRLSVIATNKYRPFYYFNKIPYYIGIKAFVLIYKKFPEIKGIYLRHGLTGENWLPGLSDIDLTVIIDSNLSIEKEFMFLKNFWRRYRTLKKFFPMLGEVDILNEKFIDSWTKFTIRGYEARYWKLIYGIDTVKSNYLVNQERLALDSLNHAITNYAGKFLPKFYSNEKPKYLLSKELHRLTDKILKYSTKYDRKFNGTNLNHRKFSSDMDMICCIIKALEENVKNLINVDKSITKKQVKNKSGFESDLNVCTQTVDSSKLGSFHGKIKGIFISKQRSFIILEDELGDSDLRYCIQDIQNLLTGNNFKPIIAGYRTFNYMIRFSNPFTYNHLKKSRRVVFGEDLLPEIKEPTNRYFTRSVLDQVINVLIYPQSYKLFSVVSNNWLKDTRMDLYLDRFLHLKLILENAVIQQEQKQLIKECRKLYPNYYKKIDELKNNLLKISDNSYSIEWFRLLKDMANDVHTSLSGLSGNEEIFLL